MPATASSAPEADRGRLVEPLALSVVVGVMAALMFASHRSGHWWGDDWALYLRQADGLASGHPGRALAENRFAVEQSLGPAFSPPAYPWGFPLVLAPFIAVWGPDLDRLAIVPVLSACAFACGWYVLARGRIGAGPALAGTAAITISPLLLGWTELIQSELTFIAVATWALVVLDRAVARDQLVGPSARAATLVAVGLAAAAAFTVRREGLAVVAAIAAAQLSWWLRHRRSGDAGRPPSAQLLAPHLVALGAVGLLQLLLPTTLLPRYRGTSLRNMWRYRSDHVDHVLEIVGLKRPWEADPTVFGNAALGWVAAVAFLLLALGGCAWAVRRPADTHLVASAAAAFVIGASFRVPLSRYLATVAPIMLLLGASAAVRGLERVPRRWVGSAVTTVALGGIVVGNLANADIRIERATEFDRAGNVEWGPTHPDAVAMFDQVRARTSANEVVAAPKARAMTWATGRLAVQVDDDRPIPDLEPALVVADAGSRIDDRLASDPDYRLVWANSRFSLYEPR